ncbi:MULTISPECIES: MSMEG_0569 family flavin-dependent oxidoreductase [Bradyrhizobium]|jgi:putative flavoprotein involved in K+ transport|uniref:MSMEG_0569 family flavin-dependent oxidoreductase n=1 Tax=Bradyrhizobium TaxID=374 RepID=UPI0003A75E6F|nr:MSMEG_0569 family flavin-dependent oxidoreductase [Bradyrhizobium denitrificans]MCL8482900.1 MSMEG_0569 family flavin-dependent oxidoreductase [Bradyrhizobium denitrificans]
MTDFAVSHYPVLVIGGGQAGLSISYYLKRSGIAHLVFEKKEAMHAWRDQRWDNFCLVTPNWQCQLPGHPYSGSDPHGFMKKDEILAYLAEFRSKVDAPLRENVAVTNVSVREDGVFAVATTDGYYTADHVVVASGGYSVPIIPDGAAKLPANIIQMHSEQYRSSRALPEGAVLVVGSGQSGAQIAEDLHLAGRKVHLAVGDAPRCARFYRGRDVVTWLYDMGYYDMPVDRHPLREGVRDNTNHYLTGRDGGRDIDLRKFALEGMQLYGLLDGVDAKRVTFRPTLKAALDEADRVYNGINASIDRYIAEKGIDAPPATVYQPLWQPSEEPAALDLEAAGISSIIWCIGFRPDFRWLNAPVFNGAGQPSHRRGVTSQSGLYFLGLPWLHTWGSGRFSGVDADARFIATEINARLSDRSAKPVETRQPVSETA